MTVHELVMDQLAKVFLENKLIFRRLKEQLDKSITVQYMPEADAQEIMGNTGLTPAFGHLHPEACQILKELPSLGPNDQLVLAFKVIGPDGKEKK